MNPLEMLLSRAREEWEAQDKDTIPNPLAPFVKGAPAQVGYNPLRNVPVVGGLINRTVNGPLHALGLINEGANKAANTGAGELALLAALAQARFGDPDHPATAASRAALAQGALHPGRAIEALRTGPDSETAYLAGALELVSNPLNYAGGIGEAGKGIEAGMPLVGKGIGKAADVLDFANRAQGLPFAVTARGRQALLPEVFGKAATAAEEVLGSQAAREVLDRPPAPPPTDLEALANVRRSWNDFGLAPEARDYAAYAKREGLPVPAALKNEPSPLAPDVASLQALLGRVPHEVETPAVRLRDQAPIGGEYNRAAREAGLPTVAAAEKIPSPLAPENFNIIRAARALPLRAQAPLRAAAESVPEVPEITPPKAGPQWTTYGPETIHPGEGVTPELLDQFAKLRPESGQLDIEAEIGAMRDPVTLLQEAYGDQWQNRLAALTGGKWGQPGSGARMVNGRMMLGDLDITTALRDYLENRGGERADEFKGALKGLLPGKEAAAAVPARFTGTIDDLRAFLAGGDNGNLGAYPPNDPAFYQKRLNIDPARVPGMLRKLVGEGMLGELPDGGLAIRPARASEPPLSAIAEEGAPEIAAAAPDPALARIAELEDRLRQLGPRGNQNAIDATSLHIKHLRDRLANPRAPHTEADLMREDKLRPIVARYEGFLRTGKNALGEPLKPEYRAYWTDVLGDLRGELDELQSIDRPGSYVGVFDVRKVGKGYQIVHADTGTPLGDPFRLKREAEDAVFNLQNAYRDSPEVQRLLGYRASDPTSEAAQQAVRDIIAPKVASGGDLAAGGGGFGVLPFPGGLPQLERTLTGAAAGGLAGLAGGALAPADSVEDRAKNIFTGGAIGLTAGGSVGAAAPQLRQAAQQIAPAVAAKFSDDSLRNPEVWVDALAYGAKQQVESLASTGVKPSEVWGAFWRRWGSQAVLTMKQMPQDALTRLVTLKGIAGPEFGIGEREIVAHQGEAREVLMGRLAPEDDSIGRWITDLGLPQLHKVREDLVGSTPAEALAGRGAEFKGVGRALSGALMGTATGLKTFNPLSPIYGAARHYFAPFLEGAIVFMNTMQHNGFRNAMLDAGLSREMPQVGDAFLQSLQRRGFNTAPLQGRGGRFSAQEVAQIAGQQAGDDWAMLAEATMRGVGDRAAKLAGDFRDKTAKGYTGKVTTGDKVVGTIERGLGRVSPFSRWTVRYTPVLAEIAARHPRAAMLALGEVAREGGEGITIDDETPLVGLAARARHGGGKGTLSVKPLQSLIPYTNIADRTRPEPGEDQTGFQKVAGALDQIGFGLGPVPQAIAYATGQDFKAPGALSRTAPLEALADALPPLARAALRNTGHEGLANAVPDMPQLPGPRAALDRVREIVTGGTAPNATDPAERRYAELVLQATGKPISDRSNLHYLETVGHADNGLWQLALVESRLGGAVGNVTSMTSPIQVTGRTDEANAARRAGKLPITDYEISQAPKSQQPQLRAALALAIAQNPAAATYRNISGGGRERALMEQWERDNQGLKRISPTTYAERRKAYAAAISR